MSSSATCSPTVRASKIMNRSSPKARQHRSSTPTCSRLLSLHDINLFSTRHPLPLQQLRLLPAGPHHRTRLPRDLRRLYKRHIFIPLHMDHSTIYVKDQSIFHRAMGYAKDSTGTTIPSDQSVTSATKGDGGVYTSLADYRKWIRALQQNRLINLPATLHHLQFPIENRPATYLRSRLVHQQPVPGNPLPLRQHLRLRHLYHPDPRRRMEHHLLFKPRRKPRTLPADPEAPGSQRHDRSLRRRGSSRPYEIISHSPGHNPRSSYPIFSNFYR